MKVQVLKRETNELEIEIEGEGHTFCNMLQKVLLEDGTIEMAGYDISHPLVSNPTIYIRTKGRKRPKAALLNATKKILKLSEEFRVSFENACKE